MGNGNNKGGGTDLNFSMDRNQRNIVDAVTLHTLTDGEVVNVEGVGGLSGWIGLRRRIGLIEVNRVERGDKSS